MSPGTADAPIILEKVAAVNGMKMSRKWKFLIEFNQFD